MAANRVAAGDIVYVKAGMYRGFHLTTSGRQNSRIIFASHPSAEKGSVIINQPNPWNKQDGINLDRASYITLSGFTVIGQPRAGIWSERNEFVEIRNNVIDGNKTWGILTGFSSDLLIENNQASRSMDQHGIYVSNSADRPVIRGNSVFENNASGIQLNADLSMGGDGIISNALIENNIIRANGAGGGASINLDGAQDSDVRNNLIDNARATGIALFRQNGATGSLNNRIINNTIVVDNSISNSGGRWGVSISGGSTGNILRNNIIFSTHPIRGAIELTTDSRDGFLSDHNAIGNRFSLDGGQTAIGFASWKKATGQDSHSVILVDRDDLDRLFVNRANGDYHLISTSIAIDHGTASGAPVTDCEGQVRPAGEGYDIGSYEFLGTPSPASVPSLNVACFLIAFATLTLLAISIRRRVSRTRNRQQIS
jgi:parallel beta-helix repeat protein